MSMLDKLERRFGRLAIPNLTLLLTCAQAIGFGLIWSKTTTWDNMALLMTEVADGQVWRLGTFLFLPATMSRGIAYVATLLGACLSPDEPATNVYLGGSVFLAFAYLYPNFEILVFFILPVKIKYLALLEWIVYFLSFTFGDWMAKAMVLAAVSNFLLFFGKDIFGKVVGGRRRMARSARNLVKPDKPFHNCAICGANERTHPKMDFRYCTKCAGSYEYCADHLRTHEHVALGQTSPAPVADASESDANA